MCQLNADAPKPPTYLFITYRFKERGHKTDDTPHLRAYLPSRIQLFFRRVSAPPRHRVLRFRVSSASVRRCLGRLVRGRKRKNRHHDIFLTKPLFSWIFSAFFTPPRLPAGQRQNRGTARFRRIPPRDG
jgi:hypothetical protein